MKYTLHLELVHSLRAEPRRRSAPDKAQLSPWALSGCLLIGSSRLLPSQRSNLTTAHGPLLSRQSSSFPSMESSKLLLAFTFQPHWSCIQGFISVLLPLPHVPWLRDISEQLALTFLALPLLFFCYWSLGSEFWKAWAATYFSVYLLNLCFLHQTLGRQEQVPYSLLCLQRPAQGLPVWVLSRAE